MDIFKGIRRFLGSGYASRVPHCYECWEQFIHIREIKLLDPGYAVLYRVMPHGGSPIQTCDQCRECGRLRCWGHTSKKKPCKCGALAWDEKKYLQLELDNTDFT